jgi:hypothetical protein
MSPEARPLALHATLHKKFGRSGIMTAISTIVALVLHKPPLIARRWPLSETRTDGFAQAEVGG